jgi:hypothetical protein
MIESSQDSGDFSRAAGLAVRKLETFFCSLEHGEREVVIELIRQAWMLTSRSATHVGVNPALARDPRRRQQSVSPDIIMRNAPTLIRSLSPEDSVETDNSHSSDSNRRIIIDPFDHEDCCSYLEQPSRG